MENKSLIRKIIRENKDKLIIGFEIEVINDSNIKLGTITIKELNENIKHLMNVDTTTDSFEFITPVLKEKNFSGFFVKEN